MLSSALVRNVLDSLPDAMIIIDSARNVLFAQSAGGLARMMLDLNHAAPASR